MSSTEDETEIPIPCVLITSCDGGFKEEELIKRKFSWAQRPLFDKQAN